MEQPQNEQMNESENLVQAGTAMFSDAIGQITQMQEIQAKATLAAAFIKEQGGLDEAAFQEAWDFISAPYLDEEGEGIAGPAES